MVKIHTVGAYKRNAVRCLQAYCKEKQELNLHVEDVEYILLLS